MIPLLLLACLTQDDNDLIGAAPYEGTWCEYSATAALPLDEESIDGYVPQEVIDAVSGAREATLSWDYSGEETALSFTLDFSEEPAMLWEGLAVSSDGTSVASDDCPPLTVLSADMTFITDDGRIDAVLPVEIAPPGRIDARFPLEEIGGTGPVLEIDPAEWDQVEIDFAVNISADSLGGELAVDALSTINDGDADYDTLYSNDIARW